MNKIYESEDSSSPASLKRDRGISVRGEGGSEAITTSVSSLPPRAGQAATGAALPKPANKRDRPSGWAREKVAIEKGRREERRRRRRGDISDQI